MLRLIPAALKTFLTAFLLFLVFATPLFAQRDSTAREDLYKPRFIDRLFFGGNFGLQFGTMTLVEVSPLVWCSITPRLISGVGVTYEYYKDSRYSYVYTTNIYGGRVLLNYFVFKNIFAHAEYELLNYDAYITPFTTERVNVNSWLVGGGFRQMIGGRSFMTLSILWNLNETPYSPYTNPIIRVGIGFGF
ncbi:MAG: hypothetical protein NT175_10400 [Bacteroidetes bacterium]|nr:hypothetical protein [Bacteroidota bacterium]